MSGTPTIDRLLNSVPDAPAAVLQHLQQYPQLAPQQDAHGYSLVHAAASYGQSELLKALVQQYKVDINIKDEDHETALFSVETVEMAKELLDLGIDSASRNDEGQTAAEKLDDEDEQPLVAAFLREGAQQSTGAAASTLAQTGGASGAATATPGTMVNGDVESVNPIPPTPNGMDISIGTMLVGEEGDAPDPELRRRIEELAARPDFHEESGQRDLRELVSQVVSGISTDERGSASRRRLD